MIGYTQYMVSNGLGLFFIFFYSMEKGRKEKEREDFVINFNYFCCNRKTCSDVSLYSTSHKTLLYIVPMFIISNKLKGIAAGLELID